MITALIIYRNPDNTIRNIVKRGADEQQLAEAVAQYNADYAPHTAEYRVIAPDGAEAWLADDHATRVRNFRAGLNEIVASVDALDSTMRDIERRLEKEDAE